MIEMRLGFTFIALRVVLLLTGWENVYLGRLEGRFAQEALYRVLRHPQYTGIMLSVFGQIVHWPRIITLALFSVIVLVYIRLAYKEEKDMIARFDDAYKDYIQQVPLFFPRWAVWGRLVDAIGT